MTESHGDSIDAFFAAWGRRRRSGLRQSGLGLILLLAAIAFAVHIAQFDPARLWDGLPKITDFVRELIPPLHLATLGADLASWYWGLGRWLGQLWTTVMMALFGTAAGTACGALLGFLAAGSLGRGRATIFVVRRALEIARTVPDLVWALVFLFAFGLGPLAGVLAIFLHSMGAQGKLFAEVNENIDMRPLEGIRSAGGSWGDEIVFGVLPQVLPNYVSYTLWRFELNVRSATIIGFVGAGGIGMELYEALSLGYFDDAGAILLIVFAAVALLDMASEWLRLRLADGGRQ